MRLKLGFSPCPNDTFIFDALVHHRIDTEGIDFEIVMGDVEVLNQLAFRGEIELTKLSYHAFAHLTHRYNLLDAGSALGNKCGPLLVAREPLSREALRQTTIAIPGAMTTANFLLSMAFPAIKKRQEMLFSDIEEAVASGAVGAGLLIHENRFTYQNFGLVKIADLGEWWENETGYPIPLGGIVVQKDLPLEVQQKVNRVVRRSVAYAFEHPHASLEFVRCHAQAMSAEVMQAHIQLYVTSFTLDLGERGKAAIQRMFRIASEKQIISNYNENFFIN